MKDRVALPRNPHQHPNAPSQVDPETAPFSNNKSGSYKDYRFAKIELAELLEQVLKSKG